MKVIVKSTYRGELRGPTKWRGQCEVQTDAGQWMFTIECSLIEGRDGDFIGWPSRKTNTGEYMNMVRSSNEFQVPFVKAIQDHLQGGGAAAPAGEQKGEYESFGEGF